MPPPLPPPPGRLVELVELVGYKPIYNQCELVYNQRKLVYNQFTTHPGDIYFVLLILVCSGLQVTRFDLPLSISRPLVF